MTVVFGRRTEREAEHLNWRRPELVRQGLSPSGITVLGGQVLFEGVDLSGHSGLWTTDGTAVGTVELTSIVGSEFGGDRSERPDSLWQRGAFQRHQHERPDWIVDDRRDGATARWSWPAS